MGYQIFDSPPKRTAEYDFAQRDYASVEKEYLSVFAALRR